MDFKIIKFENYNRKEHFEHYFNDVPCSYTVVIRIGDNRFNGKKIKVISRYALLSCERGK